MDNLHLDLAPYPRSLQGGTHALWFGRQIGKSEWIECAWSTLNIGIILEGNGQAFIQDSSPIDITPPCVLIQPPGKMIRYGPITTWTEVYVAYEASRYPEFIQSGHLPANEFMWPIHNLLLVQSYIQQLTDLVTDLDKPGVIDVIDRTCDALIASTLLHQATTPKTRTEIAIRHIENELRNQYAGEINFQDIASRHGLSYVHFRKLWSTFYAEPPSKFVTRLRIQHACQRLVETSDTLSEIAHQLGYEDPLYFSRVFKKTMLCSPSEYRNSRRAYKIHRNDTQT